VAAFRETNRSDSGESANIAADWLMRGTVGAQYRGLCSRSLTRGSDEVLPRDKHKHKHKHQRQFLVVPVKDSSCVTPRCYWYLIIPAGSVGCSHDMISSSHVLSLKLTSLPFFVTSSMQDSLSPLPESLLPSYPLPSLLPA